MEARIVVSVDDALFAAYVADLHSDAWLAAPVEPSAFFAERLSEVADDELQIALWGWGSRLGMTVRVEVG